MHKETIPFLAVAALPATSFPIRGQPEKGSRADLYATTVACHCKTRRFALRVGSKPASGVSYVELPLVDACRPPAKVQHTPQQWSALIGTLASVGTWRPCLRFFELL